MIHIALCSLAALLYLLALIPMIVHDRRLYLAAMRELHKSPIISTHMSFPALDAWLAYNRKMTLLTFLGALVYIALIYTSSCLFCQPVPAA